nr:hypothetical protein [Tanacetum cinerariifolium]
MDNRKRIVNLEYFREMLHICPRLPGQPFDELPFKEEILAFLRFLGHSGEIRKLTDVSINKLHQPWRSFAAVINKCLSGKSTGYDNFVYQVEHNDAMKSNEMYYSRFTKVIIHYFMTKDPLIPRRNEVNWHYVRGDQMFTTIKLVSRHQNTQQFGVMLPAELTNKDIRNPEGYKEYYAVASGATPPKTKASIRKTKSSSDTTITPLTAVGTRLSTSAKGKRPAKASKAKGLTVLSESSEEDDERSDDQDDDDDQENDDQDDNDDDQDTDNDENSDNEGNDDASLGLNVGDVHTTQEFEDTHVTLTLVNPDGQQQSSSVSSQFVTSMLNPSPDAGINSLFETTPRVDVQASTTVASLTLSAPTLPPPTIPTSRSSQIHRTLKDGGEGTCFQLSQRFITACSYLTIKYKDTMKAQIMSPRMRTRSAGRPAVESLGGGTGVWVGRGGKGRRRREGNDERVDDLNGQGNDQGMGADGCIEGVNENVEGANRGAPDFSTIIA